MTRLLKISLFCLLLCSLVAGCSLVQPDNTMAIATSTAIDANKYFKQDYVSVTSALLEDLETAHMELAKARYYVVMATATMDEDRVRAFNQLEADYIRIRGMMDWYRQKTIAALVNYDITASILQSSYAFHSKQSPIQVISNMFQPGLSPDPKPTQPEGGFMYEQQDSQ